MTPKVWRDINGYSLQYWGWGGEDDDMYRRLAMSERNDGKNYEISRPRGRLGAYKMMSHGVDDGNPVNNQRYFVLHNWKGRRRLDGLAQVEYTVLTRENWHAYEKFTVDVGFYGDLNTFYHVPKKNCDPKKDILC